MTRSLLLFVLAASTVFFGAGSGIMTTIAPDGSYLSRFDIPGRANGPPTVSMEGTFRVEDGFLIDTITKDSQTNAAAVPYTNRNRIVRIDDREFELEKNSWAVYPTNELVLCKQTT